MQKTAPSVGRVLTMVLFALSCFGLLLFLWLSFGGPIPFKPKPYEFKVALPEATQLGLEADVRIAGVSVGKVHKKELDPRGNRTIATIDMDPQYAPISKDANAILRQKTLLGETYLELTRGSANGPKVPEGGFLTDARVKPTVELDEIFTALDSNTRAAFRNWQQTLAVADKGRGIDLNDTIGNLPGFVDSGTTLLDTLDSQSGAVHQLVRNTGVVFQALTQNEGQLRNLVTNSEQTFDATASQNEALAESIRIFPTFLDESKATLSRLRTFAIDTDPLIRELQPGLRALPPALRATRKLAPDLRSFFGNLDDLIDAGKRGLPALRDVLRGAKPLLAQLGPFLEQLNPILQWLENDQPNVSDFISVGITAVADKTGTNTPGGQGHYLRQFGPSGPESAAFYTTRLPSNRGNAYVDPGGLNSKYLGENGITPLWDCKNVPGGETPPNTPVDSPIPGAPGGIGKAPPCRIGPVLRGTFPDIKSADYSK